MDDVLLTLDAVAEPQPGTAWGERFAALWPGYRAWYLRDGDAARPTFTAASRRLAEHMPELVPAWRRMVELAGGGDVAARMLTMWDTPPLITGCSQAVFRQPDPLLVRNYDWDPALLEGVIARTELTGRAVIGMSDCLWGLLDGINDAGLAVSLAFGGRRAVGEGFAMPMVVRYLLETCETTTGAKAALARLPVQVSYNLTIVDRAGVATTARLAPDRPASFSPVAAAANHQGAVEWPEHATAFASVQRERRLLELIGNRPPDPAGAFLEPPLRATDFDSGFGTLYTAVHRPASGTVEYRWPGERWEQSLAAFEPGRRVVRLSAEARPEPDCGRRSQPV
jgi:predicted choloylglycine hydrolase